MLFKERDDYAGKHEADDLLHDVVPPAGVKPSRVVRSTVKRKAQVAKHTHRWAKRAARLDGARAKQSFPMRLSCRHRERRWHGNHLSARVDHAHHNQITPFGINLLTRAQRLVNAHGA